KVIRLHDLEFEMFIAPEQINETVGRLALAINHDYQGRNPILLIVLNGAFVFAADLVRRLSIPLQMDFVKLRSYLGTASTGSIHEHFLWESSLKDRHIIIVEDIIDTGHTLHHLVGKVAAEGPASIETACLLLKPAARQYPDPVKYCGMEMPNDFVVGYGLDYDGLGREIAGIYKKI